MTLKAMSSVNVSTGVVQLEQATEQFVSGVPQLLPW